MYNIQILTSSWTSKFESFCLGFFFMGCFYDPTQKDPSIVEVNGVWCGGSSSFGVVVVMDSATNAAAAARVKVLGSGTFAFSSIQRKS